MFLDEQDYSLFLSGDKAGFERLVLRYKDGLIYYINNIVKNLYLAEDLAQDAFVEIFVHKERFVPGKASFKTYLYTIAHHKAVDYIRKNSRELLMDFETDADNIGISEGPEEEMLLKEDKRELYKALSKLKKEQQRIIILTELEGMKLKEAAKVLGKSEAATKVLAHRARKALLLKLQETIRP